MGRFYKIFKVAKRMASIKNIHLSILLQFQNLYFHSKDFSTIFPVKIFYEILATFRAINNYSVFKQIEQSKWKVFLNLQRWALLIFCCVIELLRPPFVLVENVPSIATFEQGIFLGVAVRCLLALGYQCRVELMDSAAFGVPQSRVRWAHSNLSHLCPIKLRNSSRARRLFILAVKRGKVLPEMPATTHCSSKTCAPLMKSPKSTEVSSTFNMDSAHLGAPLREVYAVEAISDLPLKVDQDGKPPSQYAGLPKNPFQAKVLKTHNI